MWAFFWFQRTILETLAHISFTGAEPAPRSRRLFGGMRPGAGGGEKAAMVATAAGAEREEPPLDPFMAWMLARAGLNPAAYRAGAMQRRVGACLRRLRVSSPQCAHALVERNPHLLPVVLNTALIGVSEFFRDRPVFDYMAERVLPELLAARPRLRVCSVGVSGGQELYSVAMLLAEANALGEAELVGIDCRAEALRDAQRGLYDEDDMTAIDETRRGNFFFEKDGRWAISPVIKERIRWRQEDLFTVAMGEPCELILFRNVAIYFDERHGAEAWSRLFGQLAPGGFIVTGKAERPPANLPLVRVAHSVYQKGNVQ